MAKDFQSLLFSISQQLNQQEVDKLVAANQLPDELRGQTPAFVLEHMRQSGKFSLWQLENVMKDIGRNDLHKEAKLFRKKSVKGGKSGIYTDLTWDDDKDQEQPLNFDTAEKLATQAREALELMEQAVIVCDVKRIEEVYAEAREEADSLVRALRRANCLARTLCSPASKSPPAPAPPLPQRKKQATTPQESSAPVPNKRLNRSLSERSDVTKIASHKKQIEKPPIERLIASLKKKPIEKPIVSLKKPIASLQKKPIVSLPRAPSIPIPPLPFEGDTHSDSDSDCADYADADAFIPNSGPAKQSGWNTLPRSLPSQRPAMLLQEASDYTPPPFQSKSNSTTPVGPAAAVSLTELQRKFGSRPPIPTPFRPPEKPCDNEDDGTLTYDDVNAVSASHSPRVLPFQRKHSQQEVPDRNSPGIDGPGPSLLVRQRSLLKKQQSSGHSPSDMQQTATKPRVPQHRTIAVCSSNTPLHPVSIAQALELPERTSDMMMSFDSNDSSSSTCTGDSGFYEFPPSSLPVKCSPVTKPKPISKSGYVNIVIPSPPPVPPILTASPDKDFFAAVLPDYVNVKKYVCPRD